MAEGSSSAAVDDQSFGSFETFGLFGSFLSFGSFFGFAVTLMMLRYGFFEDFNEGDTLLFDGTADDLRRFAALLESVATGDLTGEIVLDSANGFQPQRTTLIEIHTTSAPADEATVTGDGDLHRAIWRLSPADAEAAAGRVRHLADSDKPGHQYLGETGKVQIMVSRDEYDEGIFRA